MNGMRNLHFLKVNESFFHFSKSTGFERESNMEMDSKESKKREKGRRNGTYPIKTILHEYILLEES